MEIKVIVIDDEPLARQRITNLLSENENINIIAECSTAKKAIESINLYRPDLIFLDIQLKEMNGFNVIEKIDENFRPIVIFITAYDEYAIKAFEFYAFDYLLKPFKDERFYSTTNKAIEYINQKSFNPITDFKKIAEEYNKLITINKTPKSKFPIKQGNKVFFINTEEIKYIIASGYYAEIFTDTKKYLLRESLSNLIQNLNFDYFIRVHRSFIVNLNFIQELISSNYGELDVKMVDNKLFRISKSYKKEFLKRMSL